MSQSRRPEGLYGYRIVIPEQLVTFKAQPTIPYGRSLSSAFFFLTLLGWILRHLGRADLSCSVCSSKANVPRAFAASSQLCVVNTMCQNLTHCININSSECEARVSTRLWHSSACSVPNQTTTQTPGGLQTHWWCLSHGSSLNRPV